MNPLQELKDIMRSAIRLVNRLRRERDELMSTVINLKSELWVMQRKYEILEREYSKIKIHLND